MKQITLPSQRTAIIRDGNGQSLLNAQRTARQPDEIPYALVAELVEIDEQKIVYEDVLEMHIADVLTLIAEVNGLAGKQYLPLSM